MRMEEKIVPIVLNDQPESEFIAVKQIKRKKSIRHTVQRVTKRSYTPKNPKPSASSIITVVDTPGECTTYTSNLGIEISYLNLLTTQKAVSPVDELYRAFVLQDIDLKTKCLKDEFVIVQRQATKVPEGYTWLYGCTCNPARQTMLESVSSSLSESMKDLDHPYRKCYHIEAMEKLSNFETEDINSEAVFMRCVEYAEGRKIEHSYKKESLKVDIYGVEGHDHVVVVRSETVPGKATYSIVKVDFKGPKPVLKCSTCIRRKECDSNCKHINAVLNQGYSVSDVSPKLLHLLNVKPKWRSRYIPVPVSTAKIPFSRPTIGIDLAVLKAEDGLINLVPSSEVQCMGGAEFLPAEELEKIPIICSSDILPSKVFIRKCRQCQQLREYDGVEVELLNMGLYLVSHELLRKYLRQFITEGTPLISFYQELCWQQLDCGNVEFSNSFPYSRFRYAWYGFLSLLEADYDYGFDCPECGESPETVVMDGVALGFRKSFMPWKSFLKSKTINETLDGSSHNTRVFINNAHTRTLLNKFCEFGLSAEAFTELKRCISLYQPALSAFVTYFDSTSSIYKCPEVLAELVSCFSSNYPVCGFLHYNEYVFSLILELARGSDISCRMSDTMLLKKECPVLSSVLEYYKWQVPNYLQPVLVELVEKAKFPFKRSPHNLDMCSDSCLCTGEGLFPKMPKLCHRGNYVLDNKLKAESSCKKKGSSHPTLTPGVFTLSCVHGVCYGFQLMEDVESPNIPFTILRTRLAEAPKLIIYDNACNLHNYCLNRDPAFFRDSWFLVDRFHWVNHIGCHKGYNMSSYSQFNEVNTQVAEQRNATLKKLKSMLSYMNIDNFISHLKLFLWFRSMISALKVDRNLPTKDLKLFLSLIPVYSQKK